jgi:hypothetical protein
VGNPLVETRLQGVMQDDENAFQEDQILTIHDIYRQGLACGMDAADLKELAKWEASLRGDA